ncbi:MAG: transglutaminase TgpA family protein [Pyrinomonadaceae bacterium]
MSLETYFRAFSYATIAVATLALLLAGGLSATLAILFWLVMIFAWKAEGTKWQLSERTVLVVVLLSIPLFLLDWKFQQSIGETAAKVGVTALAHLIVFLSAVKLLQEKKDRDWVFLYLISFFEVLLAAGLSFSPVFLSTLTLYLLCSVSTIIAFEIQKSKRSLAATETHLLVPPDSRIFKNARARAGKRNVEAHRLPLVAIVLLVLTFVLAVPLFLVAPRSGAAVLTRSGASLSNFIGFSESVTLGEIGDLKRDNAVVMHVRLEDAQPREGFRWRGVALDEFTGRGWRKSAEAKHTTQKNNDKGFFQLGTAETLHRLTTQTVFLEPIESPVLFAASRPLAIQGDFPFVRIDAEGSVQTRRRDFERAIYKAVSDVTEPDPALLSNDSRPYPAAFGRYLQLPASLDQRIDGLANAIVVNAHARNRYDEAKAIEAHLQQEFGYSLQMRAAGPDPLADFLFHVKRGHCEYFSTAMAVLLRTRGIAARVVNGFLPGEYNDAAAAYTVRQSDAHSWVEVYFPESQTWVTFDPTPAAGKAEPVNTGLAAQLGKYAEALELFWFQYVVGYDKQEQRSLATSVSARVNQYRGWLEYLVVALREAASLHGATFALIGFSVAAILLLLLGAIRVRRFGWRWAFSFHKGQAKRETSAVVFYQRLITLLERRGVQRNPDLTPLEFASGLDLQPALAITRAYNRVRFGGQQLSRAELREIERTLHELEGGTKQ